MEEIKTGKKLKLDGERIYLRTLEAADATEEYCGWLNDPEVNRFLVTKSSIVDELRSYIIKKTGQPDILFLGIFLKDGGKHIGTITLRGIDLTAGKATIAMMIGDKNYWGKGLIGEAMRLLTGYAFKNLDLKEIELGVVSQNVSAIRAYEKMGFIETGRKLGVKYGDENYDEIMMALKREP